MTAVQPKPKHIPIQEMYSKDFFNRNVTTCFAKIPPCNTKDAVQCSLSANRSKRPFIFIFMAFSPNYQIFKCRRVKPSPQLMWAGWRPLNLVVWENSLEMRLCRHDSGEQRLSRHHPKLNVIKLDYYRFVLRLSGRVRLCHDKKCHNQQSSENRS